MKCEFDLRFDDRTNNSPFLVDFGGIVFDKIMFKKLI